MKRLILVMVFLLVMSSSFAADTNKILDDWVFYIHEFTDDDGNLFKITAANAHLVNEDDIRILVKKNDERFIINFGDCITSSTYEYCFENRSFDREEVDIDDKGELQPAIKVKLYEFEFKTTLKKDKDFSETDFLLDDTSEVTITLENTGDTVLNNIVLIENVPESFEIIKIDGNTPIISNSFTKTFNLYPEKKWTIKYTIKAKEYTNVTYETNITYDTQTETGISELFGKTTLKASSPYDFSVSKIDKEYTRGEKETFSVTIENNEDSPITINEFRMSASPGITVTNKKDLVNDGSNKFTTTDGVPSLEKKTYSLTAQFNTVGEHSLLYDIDFELKGETYNKRESFDINVTLDGISCTFNITNITAARRKPYEIFLENNDDETFYEINGTFKDLQKEYSFFVKNMGPGKKLIVGKEDALIPFSLDEVNHTFSLSAVYRTVDNQYFPCTDTVTLTANPAKKLVNITTLFLNDSVLRGSSVKHITTIKNLGVTPIKNVILTHASPSNKYSIHEPFDLDDEINITTDFMVNEFFRGEYASLTTNIEIPTALYVDFTNASIEISDPYDPNGTIAAKRAAQEKKSRPVRKKGFFEKIGDYFKNFFS